MDAETKREKNKIKNKLWRERNREQYNEYHRNLYKKKKDEDFKKKVEKYVLDIYKIELKCGKSI